jgi:hypothetical protein
VEAEEAIFHPAIKTFVKYITSDPLSKQLAEI